MGGGGTPTSAGFGRRGWSVVPSVGGRRSNQIRKKEVEQRLEENELPEKKAEQAKPKSEEDEAE